jgi:dynein heavy chain
MAVELPKNKKKKKPSENIKAVMKQKGLAPSPLEYVRLAQTDEKFKERFCYCAKANDEYYDFEVCPFEAVKDLQEYMTVSARGMVHFIRGDATFMSPPEWERESRIFKKIKNIRFFKKYRTWKTFSQWKTLMRRTMIFKTSDFLNRELFFLDLELSKPLLEVRSQTFQLQKLRMLKMNCQAPRDLGKFLEEQREQRANLSNSLTTSEKKIKTILEDSCQSSMKTFKEENRISLNENQDDDDNDEAEPFLVGDETHKQMPYTQDATTRTHYKKLAKYIRLTDYMVIDSKLKLIKN